MAGVKGLPWTLTEQRGSSDSADSKGYFECKTGRREFFGDPPFPSLSSRLSLQPVQQSLVVSSGP